MKIVFITDTWMSRYAVTDTASELNECGCSTITLDKYYSGKWCALQHYLNIILKFKPQVVHLFTPTFCNLILTIILRIMGYKVIISHMCKYGTYNRIITLLIYKFANCVHSPTINASLDLINNGCHGSRYWGFTIFPIDLIDPDGISYFTLSPTKQGINHWLRVKVKWNKYIVYPGLKPDFNIMVDPKDVFLYYNGTCQSGILKSKIIVFLDNFDVSGLISGTAIINGIPLVAMADAPVCDQTADGFNSVLSDNLNEAIELAASLDVTRPEFKSNITKSISNYEEVING